MTAETGSEHLLDQETKRQTFVGFPVCCLKQQPRCLQSARRLLVHTERPVKVWSLELETSRTDSRGFVVSTFRYLFKKNRSVRR